MRNDLAAIIEAMPAKERKEMTRWPCKDLLGRLEASLSQAEPVLSLASGYLVVPNNVLNGMVSYTAERFIFGTMGPPGANSPQWTIIKWGVIENLAGKRSWTGPVSLAVSSNGRDLRFAVGQDKGECKDWAERMCQAMSSLVEQSKFSS